MLKETLTVSALIAVILLVRVLFRNRVPKRMIYGLWLIVLLRLCLPGTLISLPILPPEEKITPVHAAAAQPAEISEQTAPAVQMPTQTASANQQPSPAIPPITQPQESLKPAAKALTSVQVLQLIWVCGSVLLGLWMLVSWLVFLIRLRKDRSFLGRHGKTCIYVSGAVKSPCLAGLIPAVYLTQDVLKNETTELILRHELMHLRHLDFLWTFCRTAAVIVYWWNPFVWAAAIVSKRDAELACDEAVAAKLDASARLAYARAILALAPRKQAALSLAGSPVKERILFLTKKQRTSVLCVILALVLVVSAAGCSVTELTQRKSGEITLPEQPSIEESSQTTELQSIQENRPQQDVLQNISFAHEKTGKIYHLLLTGSKAANDVDYTGYQLYVFEKNDDGTYSLYAWSEAQPWNPSIGVLACSLETDQFDVLYGYTTTSTDTNNLLTLVKQGGATSTLALKPGPFLSVSYDRLRELEDVWFSDGTKTTKWSESSDNGLHASAEPGYEADDSIWSRVHRRLDDAAWNQEMTPEFEEAVRLFEIEDSKLSDKPGDVSQWPFYYGAVVQLFADMQLDLHFTDPTADMQLDLHFTDPTAVWTKDLLDDGKTLVVTMQYGGIEKRCFYSPDTKTCSVESDDSDFTRYQFDASITQYAERMEKKTDLTAHSILQENECRIFFENASAAALFCWEDLFKERAFDNVEDFIQLSPETQLKAELLCELARRYDTDAAERFSGADLPSPTVNIGSYFRRAVRSFAENSYDLNAAYFETRPIQKQAIICSLYDPGLRMLITPVEGARIFDETAYVDAQNAFTSVLMGREDAAVTTNGTMQVNDPRLYGEQSSWLLSQNESGTVMLEISEPQGGKLTLTYSPTGVKPNQQNSLMDYIVPFDPGTPVKTEEFTFPCGLHFGMSYEEALALCGDAACNEWVGEWGYRSFDCAGMQFSFHQTDGLIQVSLRSAADGGSAEQTPTIRNIQIGDSIESVFDRLPCTDRELKQWEVQMVYDDGAGHWAWLQYVAGSFYSLRIHTPEDYLIAITFARADNTVKSIDLNGPGM